MWQPVKSINIILAEFHMYFACPRVNLQPVLFHIPSLWATVWEKKLLRTALSLRGYHCCKSSYQLASVDFYLCTPLSFSHTLPFLPAQTWLYLLNASVVLHLFLSLSLPFSFFRCKPPSFSLPMYTDPVLITVTTLQQLVAWVTAAIVDSSLVPLSPTYRRKVEEDTAG